MRTRKKTNKTKKLIILNKKQKTVGVAWYATLGGVTLPALVITIIIMLILAGVTLNLTIGERGFFKSTQELQDIQTIAEYKDRVEISRAGTAVDNLGIVTLDNLTNQIYKEQVVPEGSIRKIDDKKAQMTTPEGYVFIITADGIEYIDKEDAIPVPPDLTEANVEFKLDPEKWTNKNVKVSIEQKAGDKFTIEYSTDAKEWKKYTKEIETDKNITIYARLKNPIGVAGNYASRKITNIDKLDPIKIIPTITATTNTITIDAGQASDAAATNEDGCSGIKQIYYSKDEGTTWQTNEKAEERTYIYKELEQNKTYKIQVKIIDNAENQIITKTQEITTGQVDIAEGNVTIGNPSWNASTHKASVSITKGTGVSSALSIQYQVVKSAASIVADKWTTGTSVAELSLNDTVYARLWDGNNGGAYTSLKITETTAPTVTVNITGTSTNSITASATSKDDQSGMPAKPTYTFYLKKTNEADTAYVEKHTGTETSFTFTNLAQTTGYTVKVETKDNAGNKGAGTKAGSTGTVTIAEGNVTIGNPTWDATAHTATVAITKGSSVASGLQIQYQVNSTSGAWTTGTSKSGLKLNDTVYARLWDGTNGGAYTSLKITESTAPTVTVNITGTSTNSIIASASSVDNQSGMPEKPTYTFYLKKTSEADSAYVEKHTGTETSFTFTNLAQTTGYTVKVETKDNAGNKGAGTKAGTTGTVTIAEGNVTIGNPSWDATAHTATVSITKGTGVASGLQIQYQVNSTTGAWTTGTSKSGLKLNDTVYARLWDGNNGGAYTSLKITESTAPTVTVNITGTSTNSITASASSVDNQSGMPSSPTYTFYLKKTNEADTAYVEKHTGTETSFTFTKLEQTTGYTVKVETKDNAGNKGAGTKAGSTGTVTIAEGNVTIGNPSWNATEHTASVTITKGSSVASGLQIQYQVNSTTGSWTTGTSKSGLKLNDTVYARLWDGTNGGAYTSLKITESTVPTVTVNITGTSTNSITASVSAVDNQSGMPAKPTYTFYLKKTSEADTAYVEKHTGTETSFTFTNLAQTTGYTVKVETKDNAGNKGTGTKAGTTGTVTIAEGNVTIGNPTWDATAHTATVAITKGTGVASGLQIQYQLNSTSGTWTTGTSKSGLKLNDTVYARLWDGTNGGAYTSLKITENTVPTVTVSITGTSTNSITASATSKDDQSGMPAKPTYTFYLKKTSEADTAYVEKHTGTETSFTFTNLAQTTGYTVKVETKDNAGNKGVGTKAGTTGTVTIAEGNVTIGNPSWDATAHTASVNITKETGVASGLQIQYQVNSTTGTWTTGTSKSGLKLNDTVYARLWDGTNGGAYTSLKITESTAPTVTVNITGTSTNSITASASAVDNQSGMPASPTYTFYLKKTSEADTAYVEKHTGTETSFTFTKLAQTTGYTVKVETKDKAGNKGAGTKAGTTGTVTIAEGNVIIGNPSWNASTHKASVSITKGTGVSSAFSIQYQIVQDTKNITEANWKTGTSIENLKLNDIVCARLWDGTNGGAYTSLKITESTAPTVTVNITGTSTNSITASASAVDNQSGMPDSPTYTFFLKKTSEADSAYVQKQNNTNTTCSFTGLTQNTSYTVKVETKDKAGNKGSGTKAGSTGTVAGGEIIIVKGPTWDASTHTASLILSEETKLPSGTSVQYQINSTTGTWMTWTIGTSKSGLKLNDTVYMRVWDGTNGGNYRSLKITETTAPTVTVNITETSTNSITASASAVDNQSGMPEKPTYTFFIKKTSEADSAYVQKQNNTNTTCNFTGLAQNTSYTVKVETKDNAGNKGMATKTETTGTVPDILTIELEPTTWTNGDVIATAKGNITGYKVQLSTSTTFPTTGEIKTLTIPKNGTIYARLLDSTNQAGKYISRTVANIDKTAPTISTALSNTSKTTNSMIMSMGVTDAQSGLSKITWYYKLSTATNYTSVTDTYTAMNGSTAGTKTAVTKTHTFSNLTEGTYNVYAEAYDVAGNKTKSSTVNVTLNTITVTASISPTTWTSGDVTVTLTAANGGTIYYGTSDTAMNTKYTAAFKQASNATIYYYVTDGTNKTAAGTLKITTIDNLVPNAFTPSTSVTLNSIKVTASATDQAQTTASGSSGIAGYRFSKDNGTTWTTYQTSGTYTFTELSHSTTYNIKVQAKDNAGNVTTGSVSAKTTVGVAQIGTTVYASIKDAIAASSKATIKLLVNRNENVTIPSDKNITLELNNKTLTGLITNNGNLTVNNGKIINNNNAIRNVGTLYMKGGTVEDTNQNAALENTGTVYVTGGTIISNGGWTVHSTKSFNMSEGEIRRTGTIDGAAVFNEGTLNMTGGTIKSETNGLVSMGGNATVSNATIISTSKYSDTAAVSSQRGAVIQINDSTITGSKNATNVLTYDNKIARLLLTDVTITGKIGEQTVRKTSYSGGMKFSLYYNSLSMAYFPTWTTKNGQDDLVWYEGTKETTENGIAWNCTIAKSKHKNESGEYHTEIYLNTQSNYYWGVIYIIP